MKYSNNFCRRSGIRHTIVATVTTCAFLFQSLLPAYAAVLSDQAIQTALDQNTLFDRNAGDSQNLYKKSPYIDAGAPVGATNFETFYQQVKENYDYLLGGPTYVPIDTGDVSTIIPIYDKPKYVGDDLIQSRYIRAQVKALLGRTLIGSDPDATAAEKSAYADEAAQLNTLYANTLNYVQANPQLRFGNKLPRQQDASELPYDLVWPELRTIHNEDVLVPIVYLTESTAIDRKVDSNETHFAGISTLGELLVNGTTIRLGRSAFLSVVNNLINNQGQLIGAGDLQLSVGGTVANMSGLISVEGDLIIGAKNIHNQTVVHQFNFGNEQTGYFGEIARMDGQNVVLRASEDIVIAGAIINAGDEIIIAANGNVSVGGNTVVESFSGSEDGWRTVQRSSIEYLGSELTAEQSIEIIAGGHILIEGSELHANQGHIKLLAGLGITIEDGQEVSQSYQKGTFGKTSKEISAYKTVAIRSALDAGKDVTIHAGFGDITLKAVDISSTGGTSVTADSGGVNLLVTRENDHYSYNAVTESLFTIKTVNRGHDIVTVVPNTIVGGLQVDALLGIKVEYEGNPDFDLGEQVAELAKMPGLEWMAQVRGQTSAEDWTAVESKYNEWNESSTTLSAAAMALIVIVVAVVTAGAGATLAGGGTATGGAAVTGAQAIGATALQSVGFTATATASAVVGAASVSLITASVLASANALANGEGLDGAFEASFDTLTSEEALMSAAISAVTAGAILELDAEFFTAGPDGLTLGQQVVQAATYATVNAGVSTLANGGDFSGFDEIFVASLLRSLTSMLGENLASKIGQANLEDLSKYLAHAALGCGLGALEGEISGNGNVENSCASGAGGAVVGELTGSIYARANGWDHTSEEFLDWKGSGVGVSELTAAFVVSVAGGDTQIAAMTGRNAAEFNALSLKERVDFGVDAARCMFAESTFGCMTSLGLTTFQKSKANDDAFVGGLLAGLEAEAVALLNIGDDLDALYELVTSGNVQKIGEALELAVEGMSQEIVDQAKSLVILTLTAEGDDYRLAGETLAPLLIDIVTAGVGKKLGDLLIDTGASTRYVGNETLPSTDLNGDGHINSYDIDLDGDGAADPLGTHINPSGIAAVREAITTDNRASLTGVNENRITVADCASTACEYNPDLHGDGGVDHYQLETNEFDVAARSEAERVHIDEIINSGDRFGERAESLGDELLSRHTGSQPMDVKYTYNANGDSTVSTNSNHGLDHVIEDSETGYLIIGDSKPFNKGAFQLNKATQNGLPVQMTDSYILEQADRMLDVGNEGLTATANKIIAAYDAGMIRKMVMGVDKTKGTFVMVPLE